MLDLGTCHRPLGRHPRVAIPPVLDVREVLGAGEQRAACGQLTDYGLPEEAEILAEQLAILDGLPVVAVLGSSRLEEPLERYPADVILHGHADHGSPRGKTASGTPVFNVSLSLRQNAGIEPLLLLDVDEDGIRVIDGS